MCQPLLYSKVAQLYTYSQFFKNILFHYLLTKVLKHVSQNALNYNHVRHELLDLIFRDREPKS